MKLKFVFATLLILFLTPTILVFAAPVDVGLTPGAETGLVNRDIRVTIAKIIKVILGFLGIIALVLVIYAGFMWMTAAGNPDQITKAKNILVAAAIGLIIILLSYAIVTYVMSKLLISVQGTTPSSNNRNRPVGSITGVGTFYIKSIQPTDKATNVIRNVKIKVRFNNNIDKSNAASIQKYFTVTNLTAEPDKVVEGVIKIVDKNLLDFTPNAPCPEPNQNLKCLDQNADYQITVNQSIAKDINGRLVSCSFNPCKSKFTTGSLVDVNDPVVTLQEPDDGRAVAVDDNITLQAEASDDSDVASISFYVDDKLVGEVQDNSATADDKRDFTAQETWNTTGLAPKSIHRIYARAQDLDDHNAKSAIHDVKVLAAHCLNDAKDADEDGVDCGGKDCSGCVNSACVKNIDCASVACVNNQCILKPIITFLSPDDGTFNNYVTIFGSGFGSKPGTVIFLGGTSANDDVMASTPTDCSAAWSDTEIVVTVPSGAVDGPILVRNSLANTSDVTNDNSGPKINDFDVNNIKRPGLCSIDPGKAQVFSAATLSGVQFGSKQGNTDKVFFAGVSGPIAIWSDKNIKTKIPNISTGNASVHVVSEGQTSNSVRLKVLQSDIVPKITSISPSEGPKGEYITITGSGFGVTPGVVSFENSQQQKVPADIEFPKNCKNAYWFDNYVIVKVPNSNIFSSDEKVKVYVTDSNTTTSAPKDFQINNTAPKPGICNVTPDNGPIGLGVTIYGERFGQQSDLAKVIFYDNVNPSIQSWTAGEIKTQVPVSAKTGPVKVRDKQGSDSNIVNFQVASCAVNEHCKTGFECCPDQSCRSMGTCNTQSPEGKYSWNFRTGNIAPAVVEECNNKTIPSPSPLSSQLGGASVCANAILSARFTLPMNEGTLNTQNIKLTQCNSGEAFNANSCATDVIGQIKIFSQSNKVDKNQTGFTFTPNNSLSANTWHRVSIDNVRSLEGEGLVAPYVWNFKVDNSGKCQIGSVEIAPDEYIAQYRNENVNYLGTLRSDRSQCLLINPAGYVWNWSTSNSTEAQIKDQSIGEASVVIALKETASNTPVKIITQIQSTDKTDDSLLTIKFKDPKVISYFPNCEAACVNAAVGVRFDTRMDKSTFASKNIKLFKCSNKDCLIKDSESMSLIFIDEYNSTKNTANFDTHLLLFKLLGADLKPNTYYRGLITGGDEGVKSVDGKKLIETAEFNNGTETVQAITWIFKTKNDNSLCSVDRVDLEPSAVTLRLIPTSQDYTSKVFGSPDSCSSQGQMLKSNKYEWSWLSSNLEVATIASQIKNAKNTATTTGAGITTIQSNIALPEQNPAKTGKSDLTVECGFIDPKQCSGGPEKTGIGSDTCCWTRPTVKEFKSSPCLNGIPVINFDQVMNRSSLNDYIKLQTVRNISTSTPPCLQGSVLSPDGSVCEKYACLPGSVLSKDKSVCEVDVKLKILDSTDANRSPYTEVKIKPAQHLRPNTDYTILVSGDSDVTDPKSEGVKNKVEVEMSGKKEHKFKTGEEFCLINEVRMRVNAQSEPRSTDEFTCLWSDIEKCANDYLPASNKPGEQHMYSAQAYDQLSNELDATYVWKECPDQLSCANLQIPDPQAKIIQVPKDKEKEDEFVQVSVKAHDTEKPELGSAVGFMNVVISLCQNKGLKIDDKHYLRDYYYNFIIYYCRDRGVPNPPLPELLYVESAFMNECLKDDDYSCVMDQTCLK